MRSFVIVSLLCLLAACQTIQGAGEDIKRGGQALERAVD